MNSLVSLSLVNFQAHRAFEHRFGPGLTICFGGNWVGKSTLQRSILYALFGTSAVPVKGPNLVTQGERHMEVKLAFSIDEAVYEVTRGTRGAVLSRNGSPVASGHTAVTDSIEALIGPAKDFLHFQTVRQGEATSLLTLGSAKLSEHMNRVTGVHLVDQVLEKVREAQREVEGAGPELENLKAEFERIKQERAEFELRNTRQIEQAGLVEAEMMGAVQDLATEAKRLDEHRSEFLEQTRREAIRESLVRQLEGLGPVVEADEAAIARLAAEILDLERAQADAAMKVARREKLEADLRSAEVVLSGPQPKYGPRDLERSLSELNVLEGQLRICIDRVERSKRDFHSGACHACRRPFEGRDVAQLEVAVKEALAAQEQARQALSEQRTRQADIVAECRLAEGYAAWQAYQKSALEELATLTGVVAIEQAQIEALRSQKWAFEQAMKEAEKRADLQRQLQSLGPGPSVTPIDLQAEEARVAGLRERVQQLQQRCAQEQQALASLGQQVRIREKALAGMREALEHLTGKAQRSSALTKLAKYLRGNRDRFAQHAWDQVLGFASDFISQATGGDVTALVRQGDEFLYEEGGDLRPVELASGLQAAILGVAIKLALAAAVGSRFEVMLFDEVSAGAQDENSLRLTECLSRVAGQVFLISHREMDASVAGQVLSL